jgi:6-phosphogluconolactonase
LQPAKGSLFANRVNPSQVVVSPTGGFAYVTNNNNTIGGFHIGSHGTLAAVAGSPFSAGNTGALVVDPTKKFVYVANGNSNNVGAYRIDSNGALTLTASFSTATAPQAIAVDPLGRYVYVATATNSIAAFKIGTYGRLTRVTGSPFPTRNVSYAIAITPIAPR